MFCFIRSYAFFVVLGISVFVGLAMTVVFIARANIEESNVSTGTTKLLLSSGANKLFEIHGFFSEVGYFNKRAQTYIRWARRSWFVAIAFMAAVYGAAGLIMLGDICRTS